MKYLIYGAGLRGKEYWKMLTEHGIDVDGFIDQRAEELHAVQIENKTIPVYAYEKMLAEDCIVIISILDNHIRQEVWDRLENDNITVRNIEDVIYSESDAVEKNRKFLAEFHVENMDSYFQQAESTLTQFWGETSIFLKYFNSLDLTNVVELACGRGRHVTQYYDKAGSITLVDILDKNIEICKERFKNLENIKYYVNNGVDLSQIESNSQTAIFTYDSMVHFEMMDIFSYLKETQRILVKGGKGLFHHSNNTSDYKVNFESGVHGRNYMSKDIFAYLCNRAGLKVIAQETIDWGGVKELDCITLVEK